MTPGIQGLPTQAMSDEEYLVFRAKEAKKQDEFEAKAWLMTAGTLFPHNFTIQFEAYLMNKQSGNVQEAAHNLEIMFRTFPSEEALWQEVRSLLVCLQADTLMDASNKFLKDMYYALPIEVQRELLLTAAENTTDTVEHSKLIIMLLQMFPECTAQQGLKLVDTLLIAEKHSNSNRPVNSLRKLLVCDILPVVLQAQTVDISHAVLYRLLHKSIEFCVYSVIKSPGHSDSAGAQPGIWDKCGTAESPWQNLAVIMEVMGPKFGWDLRHMFKTNDYESQWHVLHSFCRQLQITLVDPSSPLYLQVFYCAVILFLRALCEYTLLVDPSQSASSSNEDSEGCVLVLVEGLRSFSGQQTELPKPKKQKLDNDGVPELAVSSKVSAVQSSLIHCFYTAARCWDLLHASERIAKDFSNLCSQLGIDSLFSFQSFQIDVLIFKGLHAEAIQWLSTLTVPSNLGYQEKLSLQAACCFYQLREYVTACSKTMDIVCYISEKKAVCSDDAPALTKLVKPVRHLIFLSNTMTDILHFCIKLLTSRLKDIALHPTLHDETALGHLLVLLQYDLSQEEALFLEIINQIKQNGSLTYNSFFNYIINIDILEEFAHLSSIDSGNLTFNLLSNASAQVSKQRTVTRGVNKNAKEDLRAALEKQVARCDEPLQPLLVQFLAEERNTLLQNMHGSIM